MTPEEIANTPFNFSNLDIMGSSLEGFDFSKIDPSFFKDLGDYVASKKTPAEQIYEQIKGQSSNLGTAKYFETGAAGPDGFGSTDAVMREMARTLADAGLTSIEQFSRGPLKDPVQVRPELTYSAWLGGSNKPNNPNNTVIPAYDGENNITGYYEYAPTGRWYTTQHSYDGEGSYTGSTNTFLSPEEVASYGLAGKGELQTVMMNQGRTGFVNKETGEELTALTGFGGQGWGGTAAGKGQTIFDVNFDPETGLPIFYNRQTRGRDKYAGLIQAVAIGSAIFAPQIGAAIAPLASTATQLAIGSAISGLVGSGGDLKQGIKAGLAAYLGGKAGSWAGQAANSALVGNIASNMTRTAILGGDMEKAVVSSLVQAAPSQIIKHFPNFAELPRAAQEAAISATVDLMRTGGDNLDQIALKGATDGLTDYSLKEIPGFSDLRAGQKDAVRERISNVLGGESLTNELLQGAIQLGAEAVRNESQTAREEGQNLGGIQNRIVDDVIPQGYFSEDLGYKPTTDFSVGADYSLAPKSDGLGFKVTAPPEVFNEDGSVNYELVDYARLSKLGMDMPISGNLDHMGGGQGLRIPVDGGYITEEGFVPEGYTPDLGDPNSFINQPAPNVTINPTLAVPNQPKTPAEQPQPPGQAIDFNQLMSLLGTQQEAPTVVTSGQDNSADVQLMENIFGTSLSAPPAGDPNEQARELARLLRS